MTRDGEEADSVLRGIAAAPPVRAPAGLAPSRCRPGQSIGPYEIKSLLGAGGMGEVYVAFDPRLGREVALKILPPASAEKPGWAARFEREARAAGALSHPNIVAIHDVGTDDGVPYLVAELLHGETLRERIASGPVPLETVMDWARQIARGVAAAHARGIVHRDLKPANLFVTREGSIKILDFGIAKVMGAGGLDPEHESARAAEGTADLSASGPMVGTIGYMSPEQVRGQPADVRSDLFSFGAVVYELVTGRRAFPAGTAPEIALAILEDNPSPMTAAPELESLVRRCLEKRPDDRFQSAPEVSFALDSLASPAAARRLPRLRVVAMVLLAALGGTTYYLAGTGGKPIDSIAVLPFVNNEAADPDAEYLSDGITQTVINSLSRLPELRVMSRSTVFAYKGRDVDAQTVGRDLGVRVVLQGRVSRLGGNLSIRAELVNVADGSQLWGEQYDRKLSDALTVQQDIAREISGRLRLRLTGAEKQLLAKQDTNNGQAYQLYWKAQYRSGALFLAMMQNRSVSEELQQIQDYLQQAIDLDPSYAVAYAALGGYYGLAASRGFVPPNETWPKAQAAMTKALELDPTLDFLFHRQRATLELNYHRDWPAAEREFRRAIELNPNDAETRHYYASCLMVVGRVDDARAEIRRAQELSPLSPRFNPGRGAAPLYILYWAHQPDALIEACRTKLEADPVDTFAHELLGNAYEQKGMYEDAVTEWRKAMTLSQDDELAAILDRARTESGYQGVVRAVWQKRLERLRRRAEQGEYIAAGHFARVYARLGDKEQALGWLDKAYEERNRLVLEARIDPVYDDLRGDPRFVELLRRTRLAP
jgi:eukaryotic-like serine/threonine-protein kinase